MGPQRVRHWATHTDFHRFSSCCYRKCPQGGSPFHTPLGFLRHWRPEKVLLQGCRGEWNVPGLVSNAFLPFPCTPEKSQVLPKRHCWGCSGGVTLEGDCWWEPHPRRLGDQGPCPSSSCPAAPLLFGCPRPGWALGGPAWIWRLGSHLQEGRGAPFLGHPPQLPQSLLSTQGCSGSRDVQAAQVTQVWGWPLSLAGL